MRPATTREAPSNSCTSCAITCERWNDAAFGIRPHHRTRRSSVRATVSVPFTQTSRTAPISVRAVGRSKYVRPMPKAPQTSSPQQRRARSTPTKQPCVSVWLSSTAPCSASTTMGSRSTIDAGGLPARMKSRPQQRVTPPWSTVHPFLALAATIRDGGSPSGSTATWDALGVSTPMPNAPVLPQHETVLEPSRTQK